MATWQEFIDAAPDFSAHAQRMLPVGIAYLATTRKHGWPRIHPVSPIMGEGHMYLAIVPTSPKGQDLIRTERYALHALPGKDDEEFMCYGRAYLCNEAEHRERCRRLAQHTIHDQDLIFDFEIDVALHGHWEKVGQPDTYPVRDWWRAAG